MIGETVSHYRILSRLGDGGMGVVYEAEDPRLGRKVALKFVPEDAALGTEALERFKLEARAASALNHPHICTIHDIGEHGSRPFIVMERMTGETLRNRIDTRRLTPEQVVELGHQIADALDAAHGARIVHRDLKPANVFVTDRGEAKLLDFGLAKLTGRENEEAARDADTVARDRDLTRPGLTLGTVAYMSPEQAHGDEVDARSDLFSLGVVLYEMATFELPFPGKTSAEIFNGILSHEPLTPSSHNPAVSPKLEDVILKALEKDRETRYQSAADLRADLRRIKRGPESTGSGVRAAVPRTSARRRVTGRKVGAAAWAFLGLGLALGLLASYFTRPAPSEPPFLAHATFRQLTDEPGLETSPSLSPDGRSVVFASRRAGNWDIYLQRVDGKKAINLTADAPEDDTEPRFSPDGTRVAFRSEREGGGLFVMGATGESVRRVSTFGYNPAWSPDGRSLACATERMDDPRHRWSTSQLFTVDLGSGAARQLTTTDAVQPNWSPNGRRIAFWAITPSGQRDLFTIDATGGKPVPVTHDAPLDWDPFWSRDGRLFFSSDRGGSTNLWRVPVDEETGRVGGAPEPVTVPSVDAGFISFSRDESVLAYVGRSFSRNVARLGYDPRTDGFVGDPVLITKGSLGIRDLDVSPDGRFLAYNSESTEKLYVVGTDGRGTRQLTDGPSKDRGPRFSPDGSRIAFYSNRTGAYQIWTVKPDGSELRQVTEDTRTTGLVFPVWARDGRSIVASSFEGITYVVDLGTPWSGQTPAELPPLARPGHVLMAWAFSPSGRLLSGWQLRPDGSSAGVVVYDPAQRAYREVTDRGTFPAWSADERRLVFSKGHERMVVELETGRLKLLPTGEDFEEEFALSHDRRSLYTVQTQREGDIWIAVRSDPGARPLE